MNHEQIETNETQAGLIAEYVAMETDPTTRQYPLWLSANEAELILSMCSLSPVSAGDLEESLFYKLGQLISTFETPHPKEL